MYAPLMRLLKHMTSSIRAAELTWKSKLSDLHKITRLKPKYLLKSVAKHQRLINLAKQQEAWEAVVGELLGLKQHFAAQAMLVIFTTRER